jgi:DNA-binding MarR family transcriptional regulator
MITKKTCPNDKRATDVLITAEGIALLREVSRNQHQDGFLFLNEEEAATLSDLLDKARAE